MTASLRLGLRALGRDWRGGELRILALALMVAVTAVTAVAFFTDRIESAMERQAAELLGADLVVRSGGPIRAELKGRATARGLKTASTVEFPSVVLTEDATQLVHVKAVSEEYPLRGRLKTAARADGRSIVTGAIPFRGTIWLEPRLMVRLRLETGDTLELGAGAFEVARALTYEPDRGGELFQLGPRVMMNRIDLEATGLVGEHSRARYRLLIAGAPQAIAEYRRWLQRNLLPGEQMQGLDDVRPEFRTALERARKYLGLAALVAVLVAGAAIALAAHQYAERQADASAVMRALGASQGFVLRIYAVRLLALGLLAGLAGCALGYVAQDVLARLLRDLFVQNLPAPGPSPVFTGVAIALLALTGFALPPVLRLRHVSPLRVLRRELGSPAPSVWLTLALAALAFGTLLIWQAGDWLLASRILAGAGLAVAAFWVAGLLIVRALSKLRPGGGSIWRYGMARLARREGGSVLQIGTFGLGIAALFLLAIVRVDLLNIWRGTLPGDAPNHFMINVQAGERDALTELFQGHGLPAPIFYPMVRGRLAAIDNEPVDARDYDSSRARWLATREFNLSWTDTLQSDNRIVAGRWWGSDPRGLRAFSVEEGIAGTLDIEPGDTLRFRVAGDRIEAPVTNLRTVEWDTFNVNFFVIATPALLEQAPAAYVTSFYLPATQGEFVRDLAQRFPSVTLLNVDTMLQQVRTLMDRAALAVEYVFLFTLAAGLLVMYAGIQASQAERRQETALLRALGASRGQVLTGLVLEFAGIGVVAGLLGAAAASLTGWLLASQVFELTYRLNPMLWLWGLVGGGLGIGFAGLLGTRRLLNQSPLITLRRI